MVALRFHPDAETRFNQEAIRIHGLLEIRKPTEPSASPFINPDIHTHQIPSDAITGPVTGGMISPEGYDLSIFRAHDGDQAGYLDLAYKEMETYVNRVHQSQAVRDLATYKEVLAWFFEWSIKRHGEDALDSFIDYLCAQIEGHLREHEVWVPINGLTLMADLDFGPVVLRPVSKARVDQWKAACDKVSKGSPDLLNQLFQGNFTPIQGYAAGVVKRVGTKDRVSEVALEDVSRIIEIIRAFHFPVLRSGVRSDLALKGREGFPSAFVITIGLEGCPRISKSIIGPMPMGLNLDQRLFSHLQQCGVWNVCGWLFRKRTPLQEQILTSMSLISKSTLTTDLSDRLVYVFASLESLLLASENDSIIHSLAERFAFFVADGGTERKDLRDRVKKVYALRSRFVHHGHEPEDRDLVDLFLFDVHVFLMLLVGRSKDFQTKEALLQRIDEIKLNGESFGQHYTDSREPET